MKRYAHSLTENLPAVIVLHNGTDLFGCSIRFNDLVLTFYPLLVLLPVLLFYCLIVLNRLHKFGLDQSSLKAK